MDDWNELKLILAICRSQTLSGAAEALRVNHSTIFRRLNSLEERAGTRLFERMTGGLYIATPAGERMAAAAEEIEAQILGLDRDIVGSDLRLRGRLRVTSSETLAYRLLTGLIARFHEQHPGILVELIVDNRRLSLARREVDVALRVPRPAEAELYGRKISSVAWTLYAAPVLLQAHGDISLARLAGLPLIAWEEDSPDMRPSSGFDELTRAALIVYRSNSLLNQMVAAKAGLGFALLPCYLGDLEPKLCRAVSIPIPSLQRELWIVTHRDLRRTARVRAFLDLVGSGLAARAALFNGGMVGGRLTEDGASG